MSSEVRGLGRGLGALLGAELSVSPSRGGGTLPVSLMRPGAFQPRRDILKEPLEELAASIKANGVLQPIVIRPLPPAELRDGVRYEIVAGERRWQAAKLAGLKDIPAIVRDLSDREAALAALIENIQREELTSTEEARAFKRLVEEFSLTHLQIAELVGRSRTAVTNIMRLLELPPEVVDLVDERALAMGHARALLGLENEEDRLRIGTLVAERDYSVRETEELVRKAQEADATSAVTATAPITGAVVSELWKTRSLHVQLHQKDNEGPGKLVVKFADAQARDALVAAIRGIAERDGGN
jgi:ParB family transcriptional regulator, chromosome partitioning protein